MIVPLQVLRDGSANLNDSTVVRVVHDGEWGESRGGFS